jgi:hypothetical protein
MSANKKRIEQSLGQPITPDTLLVFGTENGRGLKLYPFARSHVSFEIPDDIDFERCLNDLRLFSAVLRTRKDEDVHYGWDNIYFSKISRTVVFDIIWYDKDFYEKRKNAYKSKLHERVLERFSLKPTDIRVEHLL